MSHIAIIAALPGELKPLIGKNGDWRRPQPNVWTGAISGHEAIAIAGGIGAAAAKRAVARVLSHGRPDALISYGWAGALTCALKPPAAYAISEVIDHGSGEHFATRSPQGTRLVTLDHVARPGEKRALAEAHQAVLVDMEAAAVARLAAENGIPFYCFKGISDAYTDSLPDFGRFISQAGELRTAAFAAHAALRPAYWAALIRLGKNSSMAASNLARSLSKSLPPSL
jgi:adenosylhomocysteine nucleosidase